MRNTMLLASTAAILAAPASSQAPQPQPVSRTQFVGQLNSAFAAMDTSHDGSISVAEMQAAQQRDLQKAQAAARAKLEAEFKQLDTNHDGQLNFQEFNAMATVHANSTPQQIVQQFDANHDGKVSAAEFTAPRLRRFDAADANHDGTVTPAEAVAAAAKK